MKKEKKKSEKNKSEKNKSEKNKSEKKKSEKNKSGILFLINQPYPYMIGGSSRVLLGESKHFNLNGHEVYFITNRGGYKNREEIDARKYAKIKAVGIPYVSLGKSKGFFLFLKSIIWMIVNFIYLLSAFIHSLFLMKKVEVISIQGIYSDGLCGVLLKKIFNKRLIYEHAGRFNYKRTKLYAHKKRGKWFSTIALRFNKFLEEIVYRNCDAIITQEDVEYYYRELGFNGSYHRIPNGRDSKIFYPFDKDIPELKKKLGLKSNVILFIGRIVPVKNVDKIIDAFNLINSNYEDNTTLLIIGDGELMDDLIRQASRTKKHEDIIFLGAKMDIAKYYNATDVFVIASDYEGFPGVLLESMASKNKIVASPVGTIPEVIKDGYNGFLLSKDWTIEELADKIILALNASADIGKNARKTFLDKYSWEKIIHSMEKIYFL